MRDFLIVLERNAPKSLQSQLREFLVTAILAGNLSPGEKLPSTRHLSTQLGISRNTVVLVYQGLTDDGYLRTSERSGYFVNETVREMGMRYMPVTPVETDQTSQINWEDRLAKKPAAQANISKPSDWQSLPFPFIYGQPDRSLFPITDWRDCVYKSMGRQWLDEWSQDTLGNDDPMLVEQIRSRILPRRGILANKDQVLVTLGAQQAIYLVASLLVGSQTRVAVEDPGYPDARNIFALRTEHVRAVPIDRDGMTCGEELHGVDLVYTTPSHQLPTTVTMSGSRRQALLAAARDEDFIILEDDYELESSYEGQPMPALKSLDRNGRVIYVGSFSKTLFPGLRLGFMVAPEPLIQELKALRRLMIRHAPTNNQRSAAFFLSLGYYDVFARKLNRSYRERWTELGASLSRHLPNACVPASRGGSSRWVTLPQSIDADHLAERALREGILIEPGGIYFAGKGHQNTVRLGISSIPAERIDEGICKLARLIA